MDKHDPRKLSGWATEATINRRSEHEDKQAIRYYTLSGILKNSSKITPKPIDK